MRCCTSGFCNRDLSVGGSNWEAPNLEFGVVVFRDGFGSMENGFLEEKQTTWLQTSHENSVSLVIQSLARSPSQ